MAFVLLGDSWWQLFTAAFLAVVFTQFGFMGHDAGHRGRAALGRAADHAWLFPGSRPGTHLSSHQLNARFKTLGIDARAARNTTLLDLAAQLPAAVLSSLLGLGITTAWTHHAGHRTGYAAELVVMRQLR